MNLPISKEELYAFIVDGNKNTYAAGADPVPNPHLPNFHELIYSKDNLDYRDSYVGHYRSRGITIVRLEDEPLWVATYGGGMMEGKEETVDHTFQFLKKALNEKEEDSESLRGPKEFSYGDWRYTYTQEGDVLEFHGYEEIFYKEERLFFHRIIGGVVALSL
jgi:hypothetical protein